MTRERIFMLLAAPALAWIWVCAKITGFPIAYRYEDDETDDGWKRL